MKTERSNAKFGKTLISKKYKVRLKPKRKKQKNYIKRNNRNLNAAEKCAGTVTYRKQKTSSGNKTNKQTDMNNKAWHKKHNKYNGQSGKTKYKAIT